MRTIVNNIARAIYLFLGNIYLSLCDRDMAIFFYRNAIIIVNVGLLIIEREKFLLKGSDILDECVEFAP